MDISNIDFSKVEGIVDARHIAPDNKLVEANISKGFISAFTDQTWEELSEAFSKYCFDHQDDSL